MNEELKVIIKAEIAQFKKGVDDAKKAMGDFKTQVDKHSKDADKAIKSMGKGIAKVGKTIGKAVLAGTAAAATGIVALGKQALSCYGDYEQLVGGIETLFKDSKDIVMGYAKDAYKNQQMSANQYMEIATSFSASLLQGLNGDTAEAARIADMAITDMADNANKMGSTMESIQNAYQGFAKQNYTMLDNLKLGYGGTKDEMERLLADAEKISGIHYDINNLNEVYEAIHVIQTELDITGTSAEEAATTIQGSVAMMKAAWTNWVTGLMDEDADISQLTQDLIASVEQVMRNVAPKVAEFFNGLVQSIHNALADHPEAQAAFDDIVAAITVVKDMVSDAVSFVVDNWGTVSGVLTALAVAIGIVSAAIIAYNAVVAIKTAMDAAQVATLGALIIKTVMLLAPYILIVAAIAAVIAAIVLCIKHWDEIKAKVTEVWDSIVSAVTEAVGKVKEWFGKLKDGITEKVDDIKSKVSEKFNAVKETMSNAIAEAKEKTKERLIEMKNAYDEAGGGIKGIVAALGTGIKSHFSEMFNTIDNLTGGKLSAIRDKFGDILGAARDKVKSIIDKIKSFFDFKWELPKLKMPSISITGKFSLNPISVPKFSIAWNAKGGVFDKPSIFGYGDSLQGIGEAGAEAVVPLENNTEWLDKLADRLAAKMGGSSPIIMQVDGKTFAEISVDSINALTRQRGSLALNII